jgi:hypothetical protein
MSYSNAKKSLFISHSNATVLIYKLGSISICSEAKKNPLSCCWFYPVRCLFSIRYLDIILIFWGPLKLVSYCEMKITNFNSNMFKKVCYVFLLFDLQIFRKEDEQKKNKYKAGVMLGLSGREMFSFNPTMVGDEVIQRLTRSIHI